VFHWFSVRCKSAHSGLKPSISSSFQRRSHFFSCFSRAIVEGLDQTTPLVEFSDDRVRRLRDHSLPAGRAACAEDDSSGGVMRGGYGRRELDRRNFQVSAKFQRNCRMTRSDARLPQLGQTVRKLDGKLRTIVRRASFRDFFLLCAIVGRENRAALRVSRGFRTVWGNYARVTQIPQ